MKTMWLKGLSAKEQAEFKEIFSNSNFLLDKLRKILYTKLDNTRKVRITSYDVGSWSHPQAHQNGYIEALTDILTLLGDPKNGR